MKTSILGKRFFLAGLIFTGIFLSPNPSFAIVGAGKTLSGPSSTSSPVVETDAIVVPVVSLDSPSDPDSDLILVPQVKDGSSTVTPITFQAFTATELGSQLTDPVIITSEDGATVELSVEEYLSQLNEFEKWLNSIGHSLRTDKGETTILALKSQSDEMAERKVSPSAVVSGITVDTATTDTSTTTGTDTDTDDGKDGEGSNEKDGEGSNEKDGESNSSHSYAPFSADMDKWGMEYGDKDILKFESWVDMSAGAYKGNLELHQDSETNFYVLGNKITIMEFHSDGVNGDGYSCTGTYTLAALDDSLMNKEYNCPGGSSLYPEIEMGNEKDKSVDYSKSMTIMLGVIPIEVTLTLEGTVGFSYSQDYAFGVQASPMEWIQTHSIPEVKIDLTGKAKLDAVAASASLVAKMTLFKASLDFYSGIDLLATTGCNDCLYLPNSYKSTFTGTYDWNVLSGEIYVKLKVWVPYADDLSYKIEIVDWDGMSGSGTLFSNKDTGQFEH